MLRWPLVVFLESYPRQWVMLGEPPRHLRTTSTQQAPSLSFVLYRQYETITGWETIRNVYESLSTLRRLNIKTSSMFFGKAMTPLLRHLGQDDLWTMHK